MSSAPYRMIAIDLDGTLLSPKGTVTQRVKGAVHKALDAGLLVCFATGRNFTESRMVLEDVAHYDSAVFVGGAMVMDTKQRITLHRTAVEPKLAAEICEVIESFGHAALALQDDLVQGFDYLVSGDLEMNVETVRWMQVTHAKVKRVPRLAKHQHDHTIRVGMVGSHDEIREVEIALQEKFAERIFMHAIAVPAAGVDVLEIFDPSVNKWEGILHIARRHGIEPEQIIAIGDDINDLHMIKNAGLGVAMGNARPQLKAIAKRVIGTNHDEGLAEFLEEIVAAHLVEPLGE
jgi:Cof subfamily protein (haloacid dehalogenase superfamily)